MRYKNYLLKIGLLGIIFVSVVSFAGCNNLNNKYMHENGGFKHTFKEAAYKSLLKVFASYFVCKILSNNTEVLATTNNVLPDFNESTLYILDEYTSFDTKRSLFNINNHTTMYDSYYSYPFINNTDKFSTGSINTLSLFDNNLVSVASIDNRDKNNLAYSEFDSQYHINKTYILSNTLDISAIDIMHLAQGRIAILGTHVNNASFHHTFLVILNNSIEKQMLYSEKGHNKPAGFVYLNDTNDTIIIAADHNIDKNFDHILIMENGIKNNYTNLKSYAIHKDFVSYKTNKIIQIDSINHPGYAVVGFAINKTKDNNFIESMFLLQRYNNNTFATILKHKDKFQKGVSLEKTSDNDIIAVGEAVDMNMNNDAIVYKILRNGTQAWANKYILRQNGIRFNSTAFTILKNRYAETEKFIIGMKASYNDIPRFVMLLVISDDGSISYITNIEGPIDEIKDIIQINNKTFLITGGRYVDSDQENMMLIKKLLITDTTNCSRDINVTVSSLDNNHSILPVQSKPLNLNITTLNIVLTEKIFERLDSSICYSQSEDEIFTDIVTGTSTTENPYNITSYYTPEPTTSTTLETTITTRPETTRPETTIPETTRPETTIPETATPETTSTTTIGPTETASKTTSTTTIEPTETIPKTTSTTYFTDNPLYIDILQNTTVISTENRYGIEYTFEVLPNIKRKKNNDRRILSAPNNSSDDSKNYNVFFYLKLPLPCFNNVTNVNINSYINISGCVDTSATTLNTKPGKCAGALSTPFIKIAIDNDALNNTCNHFSIVDIFLKNAIPLNKDDYVVLLNNRTCDTYPVKYTFTCNNSTFSPIEVSSVIPTQTHQREAGHDGYVIAIVLVALICLCCCCLICSKYLEYNNQRRYKSFE